jgi:probable F420-dependent oxidoreductase
MKFGVCIPNYGKELSPDGLVRFANLAEELGYDSVWSTDHILLSKGSNTPYESIYESISTLFYVASKTEKVRVGVSSLVMALRNPVIVAKELATLDIFSSGRVMLATGAGWNVEEFNNLAADFHQRGARLDESIRLIRRLWESKGSPVSFNGKYFKVNEGVFLPQPVQDKLNIWIAGSSEKAMKRASRLGDAWHPNVLPFDVFEGMVKKFREIEKRLPICVRVAVLPGLKGNEYRGPQGEKRFALTGNAKDDRQAIDRLEKMGVEYCILALNPNGLIPLQKQMDVMKNLSDLIAS